MRSPGLFSAEHDQFRDPVRRFLREEALPHLGRWETCRVADACVQMHGGNGYMLDYPITRAYADARAQRIYGGSNETMRDLIGRTL